MLGYGLLELALVFGVVLALALWELRSVRKHLHCNDKAEKWQERKKESGRS